MEQDIIAIFNALNSGNQNDMDNAINAYNQLLAMPTIFPVLIQILSNSDPNLRFFSLITMEKAIFLRTRESRMTNNDIQFICNVLNDFILKETLERNCNYAIQIGYKLLQFAGNNEISQQFIQTGINLLQDHNKINIILIFWSQLIEENIINNELFQNISGQFVKVILAAFESSAPELRLLAIHALAVIEINTEDSEFLIKNDALLQALQKETVTAVFYNESDEEAFRLFEFLSLLASLMPDELGDTMDYYLDFTQKAIANPNISPSKREIVLQFFTGVSYTDPTVFSDVIETIITNVFDILYLKCSLEPELYQAMTADDFLIHLAICPELTEVVYSLLMKITGNKMMSNDMIGFRVSVSCLSYIVETSKEMFCRDSGNICEIINYGLHQDNNFGVFSEICNFVTQLSQFAFDSISSKFDIIALILRDSQFPASLECLNILLDCSEKPPDNYHQFIQKLLLDINTNKNPDAIVSCISSIVKNIRSGDEELYKELRIKLSELHKLNISKANIFECFSNCISMAPKAISEDIPTIMEMMMGDINLFNDPDVIIKIAESLSEFVRFFPISIKQYALNFFEHFIAFLNRQKNNEGIADLTPEEQSIQQKVCGQILIATSFIFYAYPQELQTAFQLIVEIIHNYFDSQNSALIISACISVQNITPILYNLQINPNTFINLILQLIPTMDDSPSINELFNTLSSILLEYGSDIGGEDLERCGDFFVECLNGSIESIKMQNLISGEIEGCLMYSLSSFILGGAFQNFNNKVQLLKELLPYVDCNERRDMQCYTIASLGRICFVSPVSSLEIAKMLIKPIYDFLQSQILESSKNSLFIALMYILVSQREIFDPNYINAIKLLTLNTFQQSTSQNFKKTLSIIILILASDYNVVFEYDALSKVLEIFPSPADEGIPIYASCIFKLYQINTQLLTPILGVSSCKILCSEKSNIMKIDSNIRAFFIQHAAQLQDDFILQALNFDQSLFIKVKQNMS